MNPPIGDMEKRLIKLATRKLLEKFDTLEKAASCCRVRPTNLSQYQSFDHSAFMQLDVAIALEKACGEAVVTRELVRVHQQDPDLAPEGDVLDEALDVPVAVGELLAFVRGAKSPDSPAGRRMSESEKRRYFELRQRVTEELRQLDLAVEHDGILTMHPERIKAAGA